MASYVTKVLFTVSKTFLIPKTCKLVETQKAGYRYRPRPTLVKRSEPFIEPKPEIHVRELEPEAQSLSSRGFQRSYFPYNPPEDVDQRLKQLYNDFLGVTDVHYKLKNPTKRYQLLLACSKEFQYKIPNSILHLVRTIGDIDNFYKTPINTATPLDALKTKNLPPNLHVMYNYVRFHPETDTKFNGVSAFPKSSTIIVKLRHRKKYKGYDAGPIFPMQ